MAKGPRLCLLEMMGTEGCGEKGAGSWDTWVPPPPFSSSGPGREDAKVLPRGEDDAQTGWG